MRRFRRFVALAISAGVLSCQLLLDGEPPHADPEAPAAIEAGVVDPCKHALPPVAPAKDDDPATQRSYWLAVRKMQVPLQAAGGVQPGFDLDDSCTCQKDLHDAAPPCITPAPEKTSCDFDGGVDDSLAAIAAQYGALVSNFDIGDVINRKIAGGVRTLLVYIAGYNGKPNDTDVDISIVGAGGLYSNLGCAGTPVVPPNTDDAGPGIYPPRWDGCDRWSPNPSTVVGHYPERVAIAGAKGYVSNYVLVAKIDRIGLELFGQPTTFSNGYAVLTLHPTNSGGFTADGMLAGRVSADAMVDILGRTEVRSKDGGLEPLCTSSYWALVTPGLCATRDTMDSPSRDHQGNVCNASTMTLGFTAEPAQVDDAEHENPERTFAPCSVAVDCPSD